VEESLDLAVCGQLFDGFGFEGGRFVRNLVDDGGREDKEAAVDPAAFTFWFFLEGIDGGPVDVESSEPSYRADRGDRDLLSVAAVEGDFSGNVNVTDPIAVGHAESLFTFKVAADVAETATGRGGVASIDQGDPPGLRNALMDLHSIFLHVEGDVRHVQEVVGEVFFDEIALVTAADDEIVDQVLRVGLQDMPEDWPAADFDHRLGTKDRFFAKPGAEAAGEDNCFHFIPLLPINW